MFVSLITLFAALSLSAVSAYYSVLGLVAIFAAMPVPIIIMGATLEFSKIITTAWLHYNWDKSPLRLKLYLVPAVVILMGITSMGSFGFLSKAHLDQAVPSGDIAAQVSVFDEKIKNDRDNIESDRNLIKQLDDVVNNEISQGTSRDIKLRDGRIYTQSAAERALYIRRSQSKDRTRLSDDINKQQDDIVKLQTEKAPIASKLRTAIADVGPIQYIAAVIYGSNPSQDTLEAAVRLVIIIIVIVFDPLAIMLLLAATTSMDWIKEERKKQEVKKQSETPLEPNTVEKIVFDTKESDRLESLLDEERKRNDELQKRQSETSQIEEELSELTTTLKKVTEEFNDLMPVIFSLEEECSDLVTADLTLRGQLNTLIDSYDSLLDEKTSLEEKAKKASEEQGASYEEMLSALQVEIDNKNRQINSALLDLTDLQKIIEEKNNEISVAKKNLTDKESSLSQEIYNKEVTIKDLYSALQTELQEKRSLLGQIETAKHETKIDEHSIPATADDLPRGGNANFGVVFPTNPSNGDLFLRVDYMPSKLFKWVGTKWIEIDKDITSAYSYDKEYIRLLVEKIGTGEYDIDDLNQIEQEQIAKYLNNLDYGLIHK